jgi:hypothetical protein
VLLLISNRHLTLPGGMDCGINCFLKNGIKGMCFTVIKNMYMYDGVKSMVSVNGQSSDFFN